MTLRDKVNAKAKALAAGTEAPGYFKLVDMSKREVEEMLVRLQTGKLTPDEQDSIRVAAMQTGQALEDVAQQLGAALHTALKDSHAQLTAAAAAMGRASAQVVDDMAKKMGPLATPPPNARQRAEKKYADGVPLDRWSTDELMSFLPKQLKDIPPLSQLAPLSLACLVQHCLNNCSQKPDSSSYDGALQNTYGPELIRRLLAGANETPLQKMRMAWSLFRTGAATLDEIIPLMDRADDEASAQTLPLPQRGTANGLVGSQWIGTVRSCQSAERMRPHSIPKALATVGGELVADGIAYVVVQQGDVPTLVKLCELDDNNVQISGGYFWVNVV